MLSSYPSQVMYILQKLTASTDELIHMDDSTHRREAAHLALCLNGVIPLPAMHWAGCSKAEGAKHLVNLLAILFSS